MNQTDSIKSIIELSDFLIDSIFEFTEDKSNSIGLHEGTIGIGLSLAIAGNFLSKPEYISKSEEYLNFTLSNLTKRKINLSFSSGVSGIAWAINFMNSLQYLDIEADSSLNEVDNLIDNYLSNFINNNGRSIDFIFGAVGPAFYLLKRDSIKFKNTLKRFIDHLDHISIESEIGNHWNYIDVLGNEIGSNFGLAHGIPSTISLLLLCIEKSIESDKCKRLIKSNFKYLFNHKLDKQVSIFPNNDQNNNPSRLAWCYGDLGILYILNKSLQSVEIENGHEIIEELIESITQRNSIASANVKDASLCHGIAGIVFILDQLCNSLEDQRLLNSLKIWKKRFYELSANIDQGIMRYGYFIVNQNEIALDYGLLQGLSGILLTHISLLDSKNHSSWKECFLM